MSLLGPPPPPPITLASVWRGIVFLLLGASFLVLIACSGGSSGGGNSPSDLEPFEAELTFTPIKGGFNISSRADFGDLVSLNITATAGRETVSRIVNVTLFSDGSYEFKDLNDQSDYTFTIRGILNDGRELAVMVVFGWEENGAGNRSGGIRPGANYDGDGLADSVDGDIDGDGVDNDDDQCRVDETGWESNTSTDYDRDGCRDISEDTDDDNDSLADTFDMCDPDSGVDSDRHWTSGGSTDNDRDGCRDAGEDTDDDNDSVLDLTDTGRAEGNGRECRLYADCDNDGISDSMDTGRAEGSGRECRLYADCDDDGLMDGDEPLGCVLEPDCDGDSVQDGVDSCPTGMENWRSNSQTTDRDGDGCRDADEDIDDDGDGLIEIGTAEELDAVRHQLDGMGQRLSDGGALNTVGCGDGSTITSCKGYELVANISLADYIRDNYGDEGWQPLGHDTDSSQAQCQGEGFSGTFQGNGFVISDLAINRSEQDCVGLFGHIARDSEVDNLILHVEEMVGRNQVGALASVILSSVRIVSTSVVARRVSGNQYVGGLIAFIPVTSPLVISSSVVVGELSGSREVGGLVGYAPGIDIFFSSVVAARVSGSREVGGLMGDGQGSNIYSSSAVVGELGGNSNVGGLVGDGQGSEIYSSSAVVGEVNGNSNVGGLVGDFRSGGRATYSYAVVGNDVNMLAGSGGTHTNSYWDSDTSGRTSRGVGVPKTTDELRTPTGYTDPYDTWDDGDDTTIYCDRNGNEAIEPAEQTDDNRIWDFGTSSQYPAIRCAAIGPAEWRSWWSLDGDNNPQLNQTRLDALLP